MVAKTRLHDPRRPIRPLRPPPNLYSSVRAAHIIHRGTAHLHKSPFTRRDKYSDQMRNKKREKDDEKSLQCLQDERTKDSKFLYCDSRNQYDECDNDNYLWVGRSTNVDPIELLNDPLHTGNATYHRYSSQPSQLDMGPCEDLLVSGEEVVLRLSVPPVPRVSSATTKREETHESVLPRRGSARKSNKRVVVAKGTGTRDIDEEQLCADIATCDTLFLDTFAQETPELIAARNLKDKVKKKKSLKAAGGSRDQEKKKKGKAEKDNSERTKEDEDAKKSSKAEDENEKEVSESTQCDEKVKKKIKIVIGKKTKTKGNKKNLPEKDT